MATGKKEPSRQRHCSGGRLNVGRNQWALGRVQNVFPGADGLVRTVEVRAKGETLKQPVTKLCLLEGVNDE